jgi:hypothetical protein
MRRSATSSRACVTTAAAAGKVELLTGIEGASSPPVRTDRADRRDGLMHIDGRDQQVHIAGPQRWVGLGVIADNLINVSLAIGKQSAK